MALLVTMPNGSSYWFSNATGTVSVKLVGEYQGSVLAERSSAVWRS